VSDQPIYLAEAPPQRVTGGTSAEIWPPSSYPPQPAPPERRRWRFLPRSLTGRLVLFVVALVVLVVALTNGATWALLRPYLISRLDQQVTATADRNVSRVECFEVPTPYCNLPNHPDFRVSQQQWIDVIGGDGREWTLSPGSGLPPDTYQMHLSDADIARVLQHPDVPRSVRTTDGSDLRIVGRGVVGGPTIVIGLSAAEERQTLSRLLATELAIGAGAVVLAIVLTTAGVRLGLRPLLRVTRTARDVSAELSPAGAGLDRRVPVTETDTEVGQLAESVNTMLGAVETQFAARLASEERMRQFLADASHELRTPLTTIRGYAELARLQRATGPLDKDQEADALDRIESEGVRMARLVDDLLLLARSDQGTPPPRQIVEVDELISDVVAGARAAHPKRRIDVVVPVGLDVPADPDQLMRVVRNLVTNAAVHTAPGPIRVSARRLADTVEIQVSDAGPGLPPEEAAHVFERFWRADKARTRARGGSGLGLSIVRSIVEAHGGTVRFDSSPEAGSTVTVTLPAD
jgi:two-component system, OmpR family, sensor kinase